MARVEAAPAAQQGLSTEKTAAVRQETSTQYRNGSTLAPTTKDGDLTNKKQARKIVTFVQ